MSESMGCVQEWKPLVAMVVVDLVFAVVNILLKKVLEQGMDHLVLVTYRLLVSAVFLGPIAYFWERDNRPRLTVSIMCCLFISAIVGASLTQYLFLVGIEYTSATFACAFVNMVPVITFLMALPFGLERVSFKCNSGRAKVAGTLVCIAGVAILTMYRGAPLFGSSEMMKKKTERWRVGTAAMVVGTLTWSSWFPLQSSIGKRYPCHYSTTAIMSFFGAIQSVILAVSTHDHHSSSAWLLRGWLQIFTVLFTGMLGSAFGYVTMSWCVKKRGPVFTAAFGPLVQVMAAAIDIPFLHEQLYLGSLLGSSVVIIGLYLLLWGKKKEMHSSETKQDQEAAPQPQALVITVSCESKLIN